ncbi:MAG: BON domain-containing protein [Candidatus Competibacter sp.]|nr:BON domain-containing protein [Candidatus Competibacter sp.]
MNRFWRLGPRAARFVVPGALLLALSLTGCAGLLVSGAATGISVAHDRRTTGSVVDDQTIEFKISNQLALKLPPGNQIGVTSYNGAVLLTGEASSAQARQRAEVIARGIEPPVRVVYNELVVGRPSSLSSQSSDAVITTKVKAALFQITTIPDFDPSRVKVITARSVVYLMGLVKPVEADAAADVASRVEGVRQVVTLFEYIN